MTKWWQVPAARADLENVLDTLNVFRALPPRGDAAYFCDLCEAVISLLNAAARCAVTPEEDAKVRELRSKLQRRLGTMIYVSQEAIAAIEKVEEVIVESLLAEPGKQLAIYGTLAPGEVNHAVVAEIESEWSEGFVRGELSFTGWGAEYGFPALTWRPTGPLVPVKLLTSNDLADHWPRLDAFEGDGYSRILVPIENDQRVFAIANLYADRASMQADHPRG